MEELRHACIKCICANIGTNMCNVCMIIVCTVLWVMFYMMIHNSVLALALIRKNKDLTAKISRGKLFKSVSLILERCC